MQYENTYLKPTIVRNGKSSHHPDELDLVSLIRRALAYISHFKGILLVFFTIGLASGCYLYFSTPPVYSTRLIVHSMILSNQEEIEIINNWKKLLGSDRLQLTRLMNCQGEVVQKLTTISAEEILKVYASNNPNGFIINVSVTDPSILDQLQQGILYALNNGPYVKEKITIRQSRDKELIKKTSEEISKLNVTKTAIDKLIQSHNTTPMLLDISHINAEWIELNEKLLGYQEDLKFTSGVQVLEDFNKGKPARSGLLKFSFLGMATGLFAGYIISLLLYARTKIKASDLTPSS